MKYFVLLLFSFPSLIFAQIDTNLFNEVEKSKLIKTEQLDWAKIEWYEKGTVIYANEGFNNPGPEKKIELFIDSIVYSRHINKKGIFHYKTDLKSNVVKTLKHGDWRQYYWKTPKTGSRLIRFSGNYFNDTLDGEILISGERGSGEFFLKNRMNFKMGIPDGVYEKYDKEGKLEVKGQFLNGEKVGVWIINDNGYHNPNGGEYWSKCDQCYFTTKSIYREFFPDGILDAEIKINEFIIPHLSETYSGTESDPKPEIYEEMDDERKQLIKQKIIAWEKLQNLIIAPFINSKVIKTEYYKNNEFISCEGECE
jgi:antitoxin component YwqK of YwqJK toxin-antitoxin module